MLYAIVKSLVYQNQVSSGYVHSFSKNAMEYLLSAMLYVKYDVSQ